MVIRLRIILLTAGITLALLPPAALTTAASASGAVSPKLPAGWPALNCAASAPAQAGKSRMIHAETSRKLAHGGTGYFYCEGGKETEVANPPAGFNPRTASAALLSEYGFPPRPRGGAALKTWRKAVSDFSPARSAPVLDETNQRAATNSHWSGYVDEPVPGHNFVTTEATITQPAYHSPTSGCSAGYLVSWVGIGGWNTDDLIQDGTEIAQGATYTPWYEWLGAAGSIDITTMPDVTIGAGDQVFEYVHYGPGKDLVDFYISDSNGTGHSLQTSLGNGDYDGSTSEWIDERPLVGGSFPNLAHYVSDSWTGAEIENNLGAFVYAKATGSQIAVTMTGNDGNMSVPGTLGTTSFTDTYENCQ